MVRRPLADDAFESWLNHGTSKLDIYIRNLMTALRDSSTALENIGLDKLVTENIFLLNNDQRFMKIVDAMCACKFV